MGQITESFEESNEDLYAIIDLIKATKCRDLGTAYFYLALNYELLLKKDDAVENCQKALDILVDLLREKLPDKADAEITVLMETSIFDTADVSWSNHFEDRYDINFRIQSDVYSMS